MKRLTGIKILFILGILFCSFRFISPILVGNMQGPNKGSVQYLASKAKKDFKIFDANNYKNAPDLTKYGLSPIAVIYEQFLMDKSTLTGKNIMSSFKFKDNANWVKKKWILKYNKTVPVCLDIESWDIREKSQDYVRAMKNFKQFYGFNSVGLFDCTKSSEIMANSSIIFPSCYTNRKDVNLENWKANLLNTIKFVRKYNSSAPIYAFISPQYSPNGYYKEFMEPTKWLNELEFCYQHCDGVVIWGNPHYLVGKRKASIYWDSNAGWWSATLGFMRKYNI